MRWLALAPLALGCGDPCGAGGEVSVELGVGLEAFAPAQDGDPIVLVYGPQGGQHLDLALRGAGLEADELLVAELVGTLDGEQVGSGQPWLQLTCDPDSRTQQAYGLRLLLEVPPEQVAGEQVQITLTVRDARGVEVSDTRTLRVEDPGPPTWWDAL